MEKQKLPNSTSVLILGITSIVTCCCYGILSIILGSVAIVLASKDQKLYEENPELYDGYQNLETGKTLAIIGIVLGTITLLNMMSEIFFNQAIPILGILMERFD